MNIRYGRRRLAAVPLWGWLVASGCAAALGFSTVLKPPYPLHVVLIGGLTSIEYGVALVALYALLLYAAPRATASTRIVLTAALGLAIKGTLLRSAIMNLAIGLPMKTVVLNEILVPWGTWLAMTALAGCVIELISEVTRLSE
jgi:hypothetical protein